MTCEDCRQERRVFGVERSCADCDMPTLAPNNLLVWEIYRTLSGPFCQGFDFFALMERWGVCQPVRLLQKLNKIRAIAWENARRSGQGPGARGQ